jgi:hypothetical protein
MLAAEREGHPVTTQLLWSLPLLPEELKTTIRAMGVREAKDFLVAQTAEQAALEGVPLSDLEKRMMYFTESAEAVEDSVKLHEEFEAHYDSDEYESKIAKLLHHAHARAKKENPEKARLWSDAIRTLNKGDHYLLVLWNLQSAEERPPYDSLKLLAAAILIVSTLLAWEFWVTPRISGIDWLSSALRVFWKVVQTSRIVVFYAAVALGLSALLARFFFWRDHRRSRKAQGN